jgi:RNase H-fold protein (predicted Holliday junction resolvase)
MILGFDPGRDKCGIAVINNQQEILYHEVVSSEKAIATINNLSEEYQPQLIVMGNQTTSQIWKEKLETKLSTSLPIIMVDERNSTLEAKDRYWEIYPPKGLTRFIPKSLRIPPSPVDDIVAIILIERYKNQI